MHEHGPTVDLHGGGTDLVFPHHECEIAQSESLTGEPLARHWLHSAMVSYEGEKMSKSLGNLVFVSDLLKVADPRAIRLALLRHHYRSGFEWYDTDLDEAVALLHRLLAAAERDAGPDPAPYAQRVRDAIDDDLDTPHALEALDDLASAILSGGDDPTAPVGAARARAIARCRPDPSYYRGRFMSEQITVTLPDGSTRERKRERRPPRSRPRSGPGSPRPRSRPRPTVSGSTSTARSTTTSRLRSSCPRPTTGARCCGTRPRTCSPKP